MDITNIEAMKQFKVDQLSVRIYNNRKDLGLAAAGEIAAKIRELLVKQQSVRMIFGAAPSQDETLEALSRAEGIDWTRVVAFHMDDYPGLADDAPQRFSNYLKEHLFNRVHPGAVHYLIEPNSPLIKKIPIKELLAAAEIECNRYSQLLKAAPIDIVCMGIGENGHIAFNDPPVADFQDPKLVKVVKLDEVCRMQQVHDGCFPALDDVPTHALSLTVPALTGAKNLFCMVPGPTKREAVRRTVREVISTKCPATILRSHDHANLYLDPDAATDLL